MTTAPPPPKPRRRPGGKVPRSPAPGGRPLKLTEEVIASLEASFRVGLSVGEACAAAGITRQTYQNWVVRAKLGHGGSFGELRRRVAAASSSYRAALKRIVLQGTQDRPAVFDAEGNVTLPGKRGEWRAAIALLDRLEGRAALEDEVDLDEPLAAGTDAPDVIDAEEIPVDADDLVVLAARVRSYRRQVAGALADGNHTAAAALTRRAERAEDELRAMRRERVHQNTTGEGSPDDPAALAEEDLRGQIRSAAERMPEAHLAIVVGVYLERHRLRLARDESAANGLLTNAAGDDAGEA